MTNNLKISEIEKILDDKDNYEFIESLIYEVAPKWPLADIDLSTLSKRCNQCTTSENDPSATPFIDGICQYCRDTDSQQYGSSEIIVHRGAMYDYLQSVSSKKNGYDALLLFSGGKDSSFMLKKFIETFPHLKVLAVTIDNGYRVPSSINNAKDIATHLGVDYKIIPSSSEIHKIIFRDFLESNYPDGSNYFEAFTGEFMIDTAKLYAEKEHIPYVVIGYTPEQCHSFLYPDIKPFYPTSFILEKEKIKNHIRSTINGVPLSSLFNERQLSYFWDGSHFENENIPTLLFPYLDWGYNKDFITNEVKKELPVKNTHPMITNNMTVFITLDYARLGYCTVEPEFAVMVRRGISDYTNNLKMWQIMEYLVTQKREYLLNKIGNLLSELDFTVDDINKNTA